MSDGDVDRRYLTRAPRKKRCEVLDVFSERVVKEQFAFPPPA